MLTPSLNHINHHVVCIIVKISAYTIIHHDTLSYAIVHMHANIHTNTLYNMYIYFHYLQIQWLQNLYKNIAYLLYDYAYGLTWYTV